MLKKINLQLFAEEVEEVIENEEVEQTEEQTEEPTEKVLEEKEETVPLATLLKEKERRKEIERKLREIEESKIDNDILIEKQNIKKKYIEKGYDEELADMLAQDIVGIKAEVKKSKLQDLDSSTFEDDLKELEKDDFFKDARAYKNELQTMVNDYKKKGIDFSIENAYLKLRGKARQKEYRIELEQKALNSRRKVEDKKVDNSTSSSPKDPYKLDATDLKALAELQKAQPKKGWTKEKYFKLMKG